MFKIMLYFLGVFLIAIGVFFTIIYTNLLSMGYSFLEFGKFIIRSGELGLIFVGIICIAIALERWIKNELLLRYNFKLGRRSRL